MGLASVRIVYVYVHIFKPGTCPISFVQDVGVYMCACLEAWASAKEFQCFKNNLQVYINGEATVKTVVNIACIKK